MSRRPLFLIVDDSNPSDQAAQLRQSLEMAKLTGSVEFASSPAEMLERLKKVVPEVILLDHHWPEVAIERVIAEGKNILD